MFLFRKGFLLMVKKGQGVLKENLRGGKGTVEIFHILTPEELMGHGKMYAKVVLKPHSSIVWHQHVGDTEPYYILDGEGIFTDNDGSKTRVSSGDICTIAVGEFHSIENDTDKHLSLLGLVVNDEFK